jgi:hypothetical protein
MTATEDRWTVDEYRLIDPDGVCILSLPTKHADLFRSALDAEYARRALPDGVELHRDGSLWALGRDIPDEWERRPVASAKWYPPMAVCAEVWYEVRPPQTPPTVRVPWWEAQGRTAPDGRTVCCVVRDKCGPVVWCDHKHTEWPLLVDADGTVEVLA